MLTYPDCISWSCVELLCYEFHKIGMLAIGTIGHFR